MSEVKLQLRLPADVARVHKARAKSRGLSFNSYIIILLSQTTFYKSPEETNDGTEAARD